MSIESELLEIKNGKELLIAEEVLEWSKAHPDSDLYKRLEWNNSKAGHEYRLWQVRQLIAVHITFKDGERKFVSLSLDRPKEGGGYRDIEEVLRDKSLKDIMMADALNELHRIETKYERLKALKPIWSEVAKIRRQQDKKKGEARMEA
jgi:hypothetical protein